MHQKKKNAQEIAAKIVARVLQKLCLLKLPGFAG
jgi:hypothetical protein